MKILKWLSFTISIIAALAVSFFLYKRGVSGSYRTLSLLLGKTPMATDYYYAEKVSQFESFPKTKNGYMFVGDSITDFGEWHELFPGIVIQNRGIGKDKIQGVIKRINTVVDFKPKKIFLLIGINNVMSMERNSEIIQKYDVLLKLIKQKSPTTIVYVQSLLPTNNVKAVNKDLIEINRALKSLAGNYNYTYVDLFNSFTDGNGQMDMKYSFDGIHLNGLGYSVWKKVILRYMY